MKTMLSIKTEVSLKRAAQQIAKDIGVPLSTIVNAQLKSFIAERKLTLRAPEIPNAKTRKILDEAREDFRKGRNTSPGFDNMDDAIAWLEAGGA